MVWRPVLFGASNADAKRREIFLIRDAELPPPDATRWQFGVRRVVALAVARRALTLNHCLESFAVSIPLFGPSSWTYVYLCLVRNSALLDAGRDSAARLGHHGCSSTQTSFLGRIARFSSAAPLYFVVYRCCFRCDSQRPYAFTVTSTPSQ